MDSVSQAQKTPNNSTGRAYFWAAILLCVLAPVLFFVQFGLKYTRTPWYVPVMVTLGALLMTAAVVKRRSIVRILFLLLMVAFAGLQWYFIGVLLKLPDYEGPARAGSKLPAFEAVLADGQPFSQQNLEDGKRRILVFFRGRW